MALSWNEIKDRSLQFSKEWKGESRERAEKDSFWNDFFNVFGISRRRVATFEEPVKKLGNSQGFIDLFWKGTLLVEHKSRGKDLQAAFEQATDYFHGIKERDLPQYILVSDFERFRLYDLDTKEKHEFIIEDFHKNVELFGFIAGYQKRTFAEENPVNIEAAEWMGKLHDELKDSGYRGHNLEVLLVRLLFCLFADDTTIFEKDIFRELIENRTNEDGSDLGAWLSQLFQVLDTPYEYRQNSLDENLSLFPYVNGQLFQETLRIPAFNSKMRNILLNCCALDWGKISPAIFGSMFQSVMKPEERRNLGAHYTSEKNILKLIHPLFLDDLYEEFEKAKRSKSKLLEFHTKLSQLRFLDPACGCGNFLIITYRELRLLELKVLKEIHGTEEQYLTIESLLRIDVDQFYGIEYDEFPARIAEVAMWLMDHQMNMKASEELGMYYVRLPLRNAATIKNGNALRFDWNEIILSDDLDFILGNPPFYGYSLQNREQKEDMKIVFAGVKGSGVLDYVTAWYLKAVDYIENSNIRVAFVSTNSISQGEQVGVLWSEIFKRNNIYINFAHQTFKWKNEAKGNAAVHVVIIGFSTSQLKNSVLFEYENINAEPHIRNVKNINPYLVEGDNILITARTKPLCNATDMMYGSKPVDDGNLIFKDIEMEDFIDKEPSSKHYFRTLISAREFLSGKYRYCLWLKDINPAELKKMPAVMERVNNVKVFRQNSTKKQTQEASAYPTLFAEMRQPESEYIVIPQHTSERRTYIPFGYFNSDCIVNNSVSFIENADPYTFGVISSKMHMVWVKYTCGRIKSDFRYSNTLVYNNFPWPKDPSEKNVKAVKEKSQNILDVRKKYEKSCLADLYDPLAMPPDLVKAHQALDKAVDLCFRPQVFTNETNRIEFLFELYEKYNEK